jgi:1-acyl-sn-glycerol-3-phosphate acyltransferase
MRIVGSFIFTMILFISVVPYSLVVIAARIFGEAASFAAARVWAAAVIWLARPLCGLSYRVEGRENIPAQNSVVLIKHSSAYETLVQFLLFPRQCWVLKRELMWAPFLGWALAALHPIAINRSAGRSAVEQVVAQGRRRLNDGLWIMVFPEGTRMPPGETRRYGISGTLLAQRAGRLLVPVAHNAGDYWPRRGLRKRPGEVCFSIGPPVDPAGRELREVNEQIQDWIETRVAELRRESAID